jgi:drug/metabolite transporter (DMT)-like permease
MVWLAWALATTLAWGVGTLASKPATDRFGPQRMFYWAALAEVVTFTVLGLAFPRGPWSWDAATVGIAAAAGISGILGYLFYYEGLALGTVGVIGTLGAAYPLVTVVLGVVALGDALSATQALGIVLLMVCVLLLAWEPRTKRTVPARAIVLAVLGFVAWGVWGVFTKVGVEAVGEGNIFLAFAISDLAVIAAYRAVRPLEPRPGRSGRTWRWALLSVSMGAAGAFALTIAYGLGPASLVAPVSGTYPILATFGAAAVLKERLPPRVLAALLAFGGGIALVAWA